MSELHPEESAISDEELEDQLSFFGVCLYLFHHYLLQSSCKVVKSFQEYDIHMLKHIARWEKSFWTMKNERRQIIQASFTGTLEKLKYATRKNQQFLKWLIWPHSTHVSLNLLLGLFYFTNS